MILHALGGWDRTRVLAGVAAAAVGGALLPPGAAPAATTTTSIGAATETGSLVTLYGTADTYPMPGCTRLTTADGSTYDLYLPKASMLSSVSLRRLIVDGIPLGVPLEVQVEPIIGFASFCMDGPMMEVESLTVLS